MNRARKTLTCMLAAAAATANITACTSSGGGGGGGGNATTNAQQGTDSQQLAWVEPLPYFPFSQIKQTLIDIEAINALGIPSTIFNFIPGITHPILTCPAIGVPVAATDQLSNPQIAQWNYDYQSVAGVSVGQEEPEGIFTGDTTGTNNLCLYNSGQQYLDYNEAYTVAVTAPAVWDSTTGTIKINGTPVMPVCKVQILNARKKKAEEVCTLPRKS
jgi:hypothetical protein